MRDSGCHCRKMNAAMWKTPSRARHRTRGRYIYYIFIAVIDISALFNALFSNAVYHVASAPWFTKTFRYTRYTYDVYAYIYKHVCRLCANPSQSKIMFDIKINDNKAVKSDFMYAYCVLHLIGTVWTIHAYARRMAFVYGLPRAS